MTKRVCYIHIGPHKSGTTSIQWFLQENRAELLKHGYFVPESETRRGAHHALAEGLAGIDVGEHREPLVARSIRAIAETTVEAIVISSEALESLLRNRQHTETFFNRIAELNLEPKLILFPRNQPQWINSSYAFSAKSFRLSDPFQSFALGFAQSHGSRFSHWLELSSARHIELIARPFTKETITRGVIREFLRCIGINSSSDFQDGEIRRNEAVGPFVVSVARTLVRSISNNSRRLTWLQAERCKRKLATYLEEKGWKDTRYCGLNTALVRHFEGQLRSDNDTFAKRVWRKAWADVFAVDVTEELTPNDFEMCPAGWFTERRLRRALREMQPVVYDILLDPTLAVEAPWNDILQRSGLAPKLS